MDMMLNLKAFAETAAAGSFSEAARSLGVAPSVITKRINQLEHRVRTPLLHRTTRQISLTEAGQRYLPKVLALIQEYDAVFDEMARTPKDLEGHLRIKAPTTLTVLYLGAILSEFQQRHARISMDVVLVDRPVNPAEESFDIAIGVFPQSFGGVFDEPLCPLRRVVCASPGYLKRRGTPAHPRDLVEHDILNFSPTGSTWSFSSARGLVSVHLRPKLGANDNQVLLAAAKQGNGIASLATYIVQSAIQAGELVPLLADYPIPEIWVKAMVPESRANVARVQALLDWIKEKLSPIPPWARNG